MDTEISSKPKEAKGGVIATADTKIIKEALLFYVNNKTDLSAAEERQIVNLVHRMGRIS